MTLDTSSPRTRRAVLAGTLGSLAAIAMQALRPFTASAEGDTMKVGGEYRGASSRTYLEDRVNDGDVLVARSAGHGRGVTGLSAHGSGLLGQSHDGVGVRAVSDAGVALKVEGRMQVRASGVVTLVGAGGEPAFPGVKVLPTAIVLLTPLQDMGSLRLWYELDTTNDVVYVHVSAPPATHRQVAWLMLG